MDYLHFDFETYSEKDIKKTGAYPYTEDKSFEILMFSFALNDEPVEVVDVTKTGKLPSFFTDLIQNPKVKLCAHNATFERLALRAYGYDIDPTRFLCTMVLCYYAGLPGSLDKAAEALKLTELKDRAGTALINFFSKPQKPTKTKPEPYRNTRETHPEKWASYLAYCKQDTVTERAIHDALYDVRLPKEEKLYYFVDQKINDYGIEVDRLLIKNSIAASSYFSKPLLEEIKDITGLENPNSNKALLEWVNENHDEEVATIGKKEVDKLIKSAKGDVLKVLKLRKKLAKTSVTKYKRALSCLCKDGRVRGLVQFYGASTGRWAGRLIQIQNLPRNSTKTLDVARNLVKRGDFEAVEMVYAEPMDILSQLVRTMFIATNGGEFAVGDWSAIEARLTAWLAGEKWRLEVFNTHGKIYEASAALMFKVPLESITKDSPERQKGKIAELALGYQGGLGAMLQIGGLEMGLTENEMKGLVKLFRDANPAIVRLWKELNDAAIEAVRNPGRKIYACKNRLIFISSVKILQIVLPSGRSLYYREPGLTKNRWGGDSLYYMGVVRASGKWGKVPTYGGKLTENVIQAIARDLLANAMLNLYEDGYDIVLHVHDEIGIEAPAGQGKATLNAMLSAMKRLPKWADGLPIGAEGFTNNYYKKD